MKTRKLPKLLGDLKRCLIEANVMNGFVAHQRPGSLGFTESKMMSVWNSGMGVNVVICHSIDPAWIPYPEVLMWAFQLSKAKGSVSVDRCHWSMERNPLASETIMDYWVSVGREQKDTFSFFILRFWAHQSHFYWTFHFKYFLLLSHGKVNTQSAVSWRPRLLRPDGVNSVTCFIK